jgi:two-component system, OmpR family, heavy metal sensor histidine kinase CusS
MRIRTRLSLWYAAIVFLSLAVAGGVSYHHIVGDHAGSKVSVNRAEDEAEDLGELTSFVCWFSLPVLVIGFGGGWWLMRKTFAPVAALTEAAARIHAENLHEQLPRSGNGDEIDRLTEVFNTMIARLDQAFARIRDFTLHASHELKTPLTIMRGQIETGLADETSTSQREFLLSQIEEIDRLTRIIDSLSLLTKADAGLIALNRETVRLDHLVRESYEDARILGDASRLRVVLDKCEDLAVTADRNRLRQLLLNLIDNAIKYSFVDGLVTMTLQRVDGCAEMKIINSGLGMSVEEQKHAFEPFFRGDTSHNRAIDGCGLGLSICKWIVSAHGGTIEIDSEPHRDTTLTVRLPIRAE